MSKWSGILQARKNWLWSKVRHGLGITGLIVSSRKPFGTNILDYDWDLLVVLDACRADALAQLQPRHEFLNQLDSKWSIGGSTLEWTAQTFTKEYRDQMESITYVAGNTIVDQVLSRELTPEGHLGVDGAPTAWSMSSKGDFQEFIPTWKYRRDSDFEEASSNPYPSAKIVTDYAINAGRNGPSDRCIVHYMQPHQPYVDAARMGGRTELFRYEREPFEYLRTGGDRDLVWQSYMMSLQAVLEEVEVLLNNYDADDVIITSDHGEAFGEWHGLGHRSGAINPYIRKVPWVSATATDRRERTVDVSDYDSVKDETEELLEALGYR